MPNVIEPSILCFVDENISTSSNSSSSDNNENDAAKEIVAFIKLVGENDDDADEEEDRRARRMDVLLAIDLNCCAPWLSLSGNNAAMVPRKLSFSRKTKTRRFHCPRRVNAIFARFTSDIEVKNESQSNSLLHPILNETTKRRRKKTSWKRSLRNVGRMRCRGGVNFENIKKNDSFVRLGGNSLSALIACRKVREAMRKRRSFLGENDENDDDGYENEEEKEPGVKKPKPERSWRRRISTTTTATTTRSKKIVPSDVYVAHSWASMAKVRSRRANF